MVRASDRHVEILRFNMRAACEQHRATMAGERVTVADYETNLASMRGQQKSRRERVIGLASHWMLVALLVSLVAAGLLGLAGVGRPPPDAEVIRLQDLENK